MEELTSLKNQRVKDWKKLQHKKERNATGTYLLEGWHLVNEARQAGVTLEELLVTDDTVTAHPEVEQYSANVYLVTNQIMKAVLDSVTPQGIAAVVALPDSHRLPKGPLSGGWLLLDRVQDPGNVGTMIRTADAAGFTGVVLSERCAELYSPKVVRAMQGSQFHLHLFEGDLAKWIDDFHQANVPVYGTELNSQAADYRTVTASDNFALVMGNEGHGMSKDLLALTDKNLYIPMPGNAESLNVAISAGILMFALNHNLTNRRNR